MSSFVAVGSRSSIAVPKIASGSKSIKVIAPNPTSASRPVAVELPSVAKKAVALGSRSIAARSIGPNRCGCPTQAHIQAVERQAAQYKEMSDKFAEKATEVQKTAAEMRACKCESLDFIPPSTTG